MNDKLKIYFICLLLILIFSPARNVHSQVAYEVNEDGDLVLYDEEIAYLNRELSRQQSSERGELEDRLKKEEEELLMRLSKQERELGKKLDEQKVELLEKIRQEREEFKKRQAEEKESLQDRHKREVTREIEDRKIYRTYKRNSSDGFAENRRKHKLTLKERIENRIQEIQIAGGRLRHVDTVTDVDDPVFIESAFIEKDKTEFLKLEDVDMKYKIVLVNQTPKIINLAAIEWERTEPFSTKKNTINTITKISKPLVPYERRTVEYNDLDTKRNGEYYTVKIAEVVFEDGTQWRNPVITQKF